MKICRASQQVGKVTGDDLLFLFVEKVNKSTLNLINFKLNVEFMFVCFLENIRVIFFDDDGWEADGIFTADDVHHQYGIALRTPPYKDKQITEDVIMNHRNYENISNN